MIAQAKDPVEARLRGSLIGLAVGSAYPGGFAEVPSDEAVLAREVTESLVVHGGGVSPDDLRQRFEQNAEHWIRTDELGEACSTLGYLAPMTLRTPPGPSTVAGALVLAEATDELEQCSDEIRYFATLLGSAQWAPDPSELSAAELKTQLFALNPYAEPWDFDNHQWGELVERLRHRPWCEGGGADLGHPDEFANPLEAALWALDTTDSFEAGLELAASGGDDLSLRCAIYGQLAGATYGLDAIPEEWVAATADPPIRRTS